MFLRMLEASQNIHANYSHPFLNFIDNSLFRAVCECAKYF